MAAPIIRYSLGDRATFLRWDAGRLLLSAIERAADAAVGSTLVPYSDLPTWAPRLALHDPSVVAVQLVRAYSPSEQREQPVVRVIGTAAPGLADAARALLDDLPQITAEVASAPSRRVGAARGYPPGPVEPPHLPLADGIDLHFIAAERSRSYIADLHRQAVDELAKTDVFAYRRADHVG